MIPLSNGFNLRYLLYESLHKLMLLSKFRASHHLGPCRTQKKDFIHSVTLVAALNWSRSCLQTCVHAREYQYLFPRELQFLLSWPQNRALSRAPVCAQALQYPGPCSVHTSENWQLADIEPCPRPAWSHSPARSHSPAGSHSPARSHSLLRIGSWQVTLTGILNTEWCKCQPRYDTQMLRYFFVKLTVPCRWYLLSWCLLLLLPAPQLKFQEYRIINI